MSYYVQESHAGWVRNGSKLNLVRKRVRQPGSVGRLQFTAAVASTVLSSYHLITASLPNVGWHSMLMCCDGS
jgi:hypothetical protein